MNGVATVAIPTLDAGPRFARILDAIAAQRTGFEVELLVCDLASGDGTAALARSRGARVIEIARADFSHGATRNRLAAEALGSHIAFLTQDAVPASTTWLAELVAGFALAPEVGLVYGPYRPRPDASLSVRRELETWFASLSPDGGPRIDVLAPAERDAPADRFLGPLGYFTDANGCISRAAWERVPFREVAYAEDHLLAQDMLRAGLAKVYLPGAAVEHSHEYSLGEWLRRSFDEARGVRAIYGLVPGGAPREAARNLRGNVGADVRRARVQRGPAAVPGALARSLAHHGARGAGTVLGARADALPPMIRARLSLERRR